MSLGLPIDVAVALVLDEALLWVDFESFPDRVFVGLSRRSVLLLKVPRDEAVLRMRAHTRVRGKMTKPARGAPKSAYLALKIPSRVVRLLLRLRTIHRIITFISYKRTRTTRRPTQLLTQAQTRTRPPGLTIRNNSFSAC